MRGALALRYSVGVAVAALIAPWEAGAQQAAPVMQPGSRLQEIDLSVLTLYESNVAGSDAALAALRGIRPSDVIVEPSVHFILARPAGRETVYLEGDAGYDFHARNSRLNRENIDIHPGVLAQVGVCQGGVNGEYSRAQSDLNELARSPAGLLTPFQEKNVLQVEEVGGDATCGRNQGIAPSFTASETWTENSSAIQRYIDAQTFSGSAGLTYQRPVLGSVRFFGAFSETLYPNRAGLAQILGIAVSTGYKTASGGVTYTRAVGSRLQGSVSLSYTTLNQEGLTQARFSGPTYSAALIYQLSSRWSVTTQVSRATVPSNRLNSSFAIDELYLGQMSYELSSRLTLQGGASLNHDAYNATAKEAVFDLTDEKIYRVFGEADLRLTRRLALALKVEHRQQNANFPGLSYPDTRAGLTVRATF